MTEFKIGDWIVITYCTMYHMKPYIRQYTGAQDKNHAGIKSIELWTPKEGDWCWFWDDNLTHSAHLMSFHMKYTSDAKVTSYFGVSSYAKEGFPYTPQYQHCEPFVNKLPTFLKNTNE